MTDKIGVGIYGSNGHQIHRRLVDRPRARLVATAAFEPADLPDELRTDGSVAHYPTLETLLTDDRVEFVSLCSPRRCDQAADAMRCLRAGRHVYAEKPCAMAEQDLEAILEAARESRRQFREMANGISDVQPFLAMKKLVAAGTIGTVVQVLAQKSYPYHDRRPQDEDVDGGLIAQAAGYCMRFVEQVAGVPIATIEAVETTLGNPRRGGLRMAASIMMTLTNGGVASALANYLNPKSFGSWGNETLRIFGTDGMVEAVDGAKRTRLVLADRDAGALQLDEPGRDYLHDYLAALQGDGRMMRRVEDEVHATRMALRAKASAARRDG